MRRINAIRVFTMFLIAAVPVRINSQSVWQKMKDAAKQAGRNCVRIAVLATPAVAAVN